MHVLDAVIFMHILDAVIFIHILHAVIFMHILDAVIFMHILNAFDIYHILYVNLIDRFPLVLYISASRPQGHYGNLRFLHGVAPPTNV